MEKIYYVYELYDLYGSCVYVGETINPKRRLWQHTYKTGKFYGVQVTMYIVTEFTNRKDALSLEGQLKLQYGFEWYEGNCQISRAIAGGKAMGATNGKLRRVITYEQAEDIRSIYATENISQQQLAERLGMTRSTIRNIIMQRTYTKP